jgi:hypothetical protein
VNTIREGFKREVEALMPVLHSVPMGDLSLGAGFVKPANATRGSRTPRP